MNLLQLVLKQMRQRALSSCLTIISVTLGVALAIAILVVQRESQSVLAQSDFGYQLVVGPKGSGLQLVLNSVYHIDQSQGNIPYAIYERLTGSGELAQYVRLAVPIAMGDNYEGYRIVGTLPAMFGFDDQGQPLEGYDDRGRLMSDYISPRTLLEKRNDGVRVAAPALEYRDGYKFHLAQGRMFHADRFEAVIGSHIATATGLTIGSTFKATHDLTTTETSDEHDEHWTVVGILEPTGTANDRLLFIPLKTFYAIGGHADALVQIAAVRDDTPRPETHDEHADEDADGHDHDHVEADHAHDAHDEHTDDDDGHDEAAHADNHDQHDHDHGHYTVRADGTIDLHLPRDQWQVSAILADSRGGYHTQHLMYVLNNRDEAMAVNPAAVMREFFDTFLNTGSMALMVISVLVTVVAAVSILVSIYNSISARIRDIAILRALGATRGRILAIIAAEATLIGMVGGILGLIIGHGVAAGGSAYLKRLVGQGFSWHTIAWPELAFLGAVVIIAFLAGLVPALKAYQAPVADNLVSQ